MNIFVDAWYEKNHNIIKKHVVFFLVKLLHLKELLMWHFILNEFNITKITSCIDALAIRNK